MNIFTKYIPFEHYENFILNNSSFILPSKKTIDFKGKPISIFNDYIPNLQDLNVNPYNILIIQEPNEIFGLHDWAINNKDLFSCILTWSDKILNSCENSYLHTFGTSFLWQIPNFYKNLKTENKSLGVSFLCGNKQLIEGHHLRHKIYKKQSEVIIPNKWIYTTPEGKEICFDKYMFNISIENCKHLNWFTEKLIDCFLTKTIPLYWGCPNIGNFFNEEGIITFENENDLLKKINNLTSDDYNSRIHAINENYTKALYYADFFYRLNEILEQIIIDNNI
jgi:hypothetical protein